MCSAERAALANLRVLDLSRVRSGPTCVRQFADFGADVIQIESPPGVDPNEGMGGSRLGSDFQNLHRNKRSMTLNLKESQGRTIFMQLVETSDVVVENYRPAVKHRLGIDYESLRAVNPRIILASISGFGQDGPYAARPGFDQIAQGMGGLMSVTGLPGGPPLRAGTAVADLAAGLFGAIGIMTALIERQTSGEGQWVQSSLLMSQIALMDFQAARYLMEGEVALQVGNDHPTTMPTSTYQTKDGYVNIGAVGDGMWRALCTALMRGDLLDRTEFSNNRGRVEHRMILNDEIEQATRTRTTADWVAVLNEAGIPCGPVYSMDQVFADPHVQHIGAATALPHPILGDIRVVSQASTLSRTPASIVSPAADLGAHTDEILLELGWDATDIAALRDARVV